MQRHLTPILALAAAALLPACATPPATPVPAGAQRMEAKEIRALFAYPTRLDNGVRGGLTYRFTPDGTVEFGACASRPTRGSAGRSTGWAAGASTSTCRNTTRTTTR